MSRPLPPSPAAPPPSLIALRRTRSRPGSTASPTTASPSRRPRSAILHFALFFAHPTHPTPPAPADAPGAQDATKGSEYAQQQYEKYNTAYNDASKAAHNLRTQNNAERQSLVDEQNLIQEIMRLVGMDIDADTDEDI